MDKYERRRQRVMELIAQRCGGVAAAFARTIGRDASYVSRMLYPEGKSGKKRIADDMMEIIEKAYDLPRGRLDDDAPLSPPAHQPRSVANVTPAPDIKGRIPLLSWVSAGKWSEAVDIYEPGYAERWLPHLKNNGEHTYALRVDGDSMTAPYGKSYPDGCIVFVDPMRRNPTSGEKIIAKLEGVNEVTFKTYIEDAGRRWLKPLNPQHPPIMDPFKVLGTVIGKWEDE